MSRSPARPPPCAGSPEPTTPSSRSGPPMDGAGPGPPASRRAAAGPPNKMRPISTAAPAARHEPGPAGEQTLHGYAHPRPGTAARRARRDGHRHLPQRPGPAPRHRTLRQVRRDHDLLRPGRLPLCADCRPSGTPCRKRPQTPLRWCCIRYHPAFRERVNRPEPDAGPDRKTAAKARFGQTCVSVAADFGITPARAGQIVTADPRDELWIKDADHATLRPVTESAALALSAAWRRRRPRPVGSRS